MNQNITYLEAFLKKHIQDYDFVMETKPSFSGSAVLYRASVGKATGGNLATSGYEFNFEDAINNLVTELKKNDK